MPVVCGNQNRFWTLPDRAWVTNCLLLRTVDQNRSKHPGHKYQWPGETWVLPSGGVKSLFKRCTHVNLDVRWAKWSGGESAIMNQILPQNMRVWKWLSTSRLKCARKGQTLLWTMHDVPRSFPNKEIHIMPTEAREICQFWWQISLLSINN